MSKQAKIEFLVKRLGDRFVTKAFLESKSDQFINNLYDLESQQIDRMMDSMICETF